MQSPLLWLGSSLGLVQLCRIHGLELFPAALTMHHLDCFLPPFLNNRMAHANLNFLFGLPPCFV